MSFLRPALFLVFFFYFAAFLLPCEAAGNRRTLEERVAEEGFCYATLGRFAGAVTKYTAEFGRVVFRTDLVKDSFISLASVKSFHEDPSREYEYTSASGWRSRKRELVIRHFVVLAENGGIDAIPRMVRAIRHAPIHNRAAYHSVDVFGQTYSPKTVAESSDSAWLQTQFEFFGRAAIEEILHRYVLAQGPVRELAGMLNRSFNRRETIHEIAHLKRDQTLEVAAYLRDGGFRNLSDELLVK